MAAVTTTSPSGPPAISKVLFYTEKFSWNVRDIIQPAQLTTPPVSTAAAATAAASTASNRTITTDNVPSQKSGNFPTQVFESKNGQRWCMFFRVCDNLVGVFLQIQGPITYRKETKMRFFVTGPEDDIKKAGLAKKPFSTEHTFERVLDDWGFSSFVKPAQLVNLLALTIHLEITLDAPETEDDVAPFWSTLVNNKSGSDCSFLVEGRKIYAFSPIICGRSSYFHGMLRADFAESRFSVDEPIELHGVTYEAVLACLEWMYTGQCPGPETAFAMLRDIYVAADMYGLELLSNHILPLIEAALGPDTFGDIYVLARKFHLKEVASRAVEFWKEHYEKSRVEGTEKEQVGIICEKILSSGESELMALIDWFAGKDT
ncbi:hypothetical protein HK102_009894 [Quaeritorhiza haematococci]|nr:hypothetical protein HK102_009894 [Quaeritorhiza haematococci]